MKFTPAADFSFTRLVKLLILLSLGLQIITISQIYFFKRELFNDQAFLLFRLFRGTLLSFLAGAILAYPFLILLRYLNKRLPWKKSAFKRIFIQFPLAILAGLLITPVILAPAALLFDMEQGPTVLVNNAYYLVVLSLFLMVIMEGLMFFEESANAKKTADNLWKELEIRKREQLTIQLDESREQLHSLLSNLGGAAYRCYFDIDYTMQYISEKIFDISGFHAADFMQNATHSFLSIIHPDDRDLCKNNIHEASLLKTPYEFEYRIIHKNGGIVWVSENGKCIFDKKDEVAFLDGIINDITPRKNAERVAKESERRYKELMDFLPQPIFELNLQGEIVLSNKAGDEFFGPIPDNPDEKISALDCFVNEDKPRIIENFKKSAQGIATEPGEFTAIMKDGTPCPVMVFGNPIRRNDEIVGRRGIIIDISERKKYELEILKAKEELGQINNSLEQMIAKRTSELTEANTILLKVQKENLQSQFEVLKSQINPHFMFNSLNVLSGLINVDVAKAQLFIDEFSQIYRYVLETIEQPVVTLNQELEFMRSYLFLQQIRYGESLTYKVNISAELLKMVVPPLSLQVLLENAMKHNIVNEEKPLKIEIYSEGNFLHIKNNIQPKISGTSTGLGLKNLVKRYALISTLETSFKVINNFYVARIPLIKIEQDECTDC